jgi:hypothetical protein
MYEHTKTEAWNTQIIVSTLLARFMVNLRVFPSTLMIQPRTQCCVP